MTYKEQVLFKEIKNAAENVKSETEILPYRFTEEEFQKAALAVRFDCPMLFYVDLNKMELFSDRYKTNVKLYYFESASSIKNMKMEVEAVSAAAMAYIQNATTDFEKAVILHDFLVRSSALSNNTNDDNSASEHTPYGALVEKSAFCDGYSLALKILLNRIGIECITAEGKANGQPHVWNIAKLDGEYYHIDSTWNDGDMEFANDLIFHGFFALSDSALFTTHTPSEIFDVPECKTENNYYAQKNAVVKTADSFDEIVYGQAKEAIEKKQTYFEIYTEYTKNDADFKKQLLSLLETINGEYESPVISKSYRAFNATENGHAMTIQIYYLNK